MRLDLDVLTLCDAALNAGYEITKQEQAVEEAFNAAMAELNTALKAIAKAAGGIRGHALCEYNKSTYNPAKPYIYVIPGSANADGGRGPYIDRTTGEIGDCIRPQHLIAVWQALPGILSHHIAACEGDSEYQAWLSQGLNSIWHGSQALRAFQQSQMPLTWRQALMERALEDAELQEALKAAAATGQKDAPIKLLLDQAGEEEEEKEGEEGRQKEEERREKETV